MAYSFALKHPASMPRRVRRIEIAFSIHPRLSLGDAEDRDVHEAMLSDLVNEALAPLRFDGRSVLDADYRLTNATNAHLVLDGEADTRSILTAVLRAFDLFARPKADELQGGGTVDERRLFTEADVAVLHSAPPDDLMPFTADGFAGPTRLPAYLDGVDAVIRLGTDASFDLEELSEAIEAFLQDSCAVPRDKVDAWLAAGGDEVSVWSEENGGSILQIAPYRGEGAALAFLAASLGGTVELLHVED